MCSPLELSHVFPIAYVHVVDRLLDGALSKRVRGRAAEKCPSVSQSGFILRFPRLINSLLHGHVCNMRNIPQEL